MSKYIVIPNIKVNNANAQPAWWFLSAPALTAYVGFAHALALFLKAKYHEGVAVIHHDIQFLGENIDKRIGFRPHQFRSASLIDDDDYDKRSKLLSSQPTARCHLEISLVILMPDDVPLSPIENFLRSARIAGGSIIRHSKVRYDANTQDEVIGMIKNGYSILDRQDLMVIKEGDRDMLDALLRNINQKSWIVPTCLGYIGISSIENRDKARNGLPHLYVEPLVGLVQYKNVRNAKLDFWRYSYSQPNVFSITTH